MPPKWTMPSQPSTSAFTWAKSASSQGTTSSCAAAVPSSAMSDRRRISARPVRRRRASEPRPPAAPVMRSRFIGIPLRQLQRGYCSRPRDGGLPGRRLQQVGQQQRGGRHEGDKSEEHTSELQSLMRTSYAVFCLKKKKTREHTDQTRE